MALNHHDQEIVDLYHEGSTDEPPPRLDAAILSAAREALAASPTPSAAQRKTGWWKRFSVPAQFAVSFMLVAMLLAYMGDPLVDRLERRVGGGVAAGFTIYFFSKVVYAFGLSSTLPQSLAAWSPALVAALIGAGFEVGARQGGGTRLALVLPADGFSMRSHP